LLATAAANLGAMQQHQQQQPEVPAMVPSPVVTPTSPFATDFTANTKLPPTPTRDDDFDFSPWDTHLVEADAETPHLVVHAKVYALAEKYGIMGLKGLARSKFTTQAAVHYTTAEFAQAMELVYESTVDSDRGLRDVVIQAFRSHPELAQREDVEDVVRETPGLAWELFRVGWGLPIVTRY
jgi:hypothetical protein